MEKDKLGRFVAHRQLLNGKIQCAKCKRWLPLDDVHFQRSKSVKYGFKETCKECKGLIFKEPPHKKVIDGKMLCKKCGRWLPLDHEHFYYGDPHGAIRFFATCKECDGRKFMSMRRGAPKGMKRCKQCNELFPETEEHFYFFFSRGRDRSTSRCRACHKEHHRLAANKRRDTNINSRIQDNVRRRINYALKGIGKTKHTEELIGCSIEFLKQHLEQQFQSGMLWDNYGSGDGCWEIDHIKPVPLFDLTRIEQQKEYFNWHNMRPMWSLLNRQKSSKHNGIMYRQKCSIKK